MNLHGIVRGAIQTVNPDIPATLRRSLGYQNDAAGEQTPEFKTLRGSIQVQPLDGGMLQHANNLNLQGTLRAVYLYGSWFGVIRKGERGGDVLCFDDVVSKCPTEWLVVDVVESWPDWTKVIVCLQQ